jgi:hypothetical protein
MRDRMPRRNAKQKRQAKLYFGCSRQMKIASMQFLSGNQIKGARGARPQFFSP